MSILERQDKFAFASSDFVALLRIMYESRKRHCDRSFRITEEPDRYPRAYSVADSLSTARRIRIDLRTQTWTKPRR